MSTRTEAQVLGSPRAEPSKAPHPFLGRLDCADTGRGLRIDLEAELAAVPHVSGQLIKIQVKTSRSVEITDKDVVCQIPKKLAVYADSCRLPVVLVRVDLEGQKAWYVWIQQWLLEKQRSGHRMEDMSESVTYHIPAGRTLQQGLVNELRDIAQWRTRTQLVLTVQLGIANEHFPVNLVIEQAIALGDRLWATDKGNQASSTLYAICRHFGQNFSAEQIWRMVTRDESTSRTGLNALGIHLTHALESDAT